MEHFSIHMKKVAMMEQVLSLLESIQTSRVSSVLIEVAGYCRKKQNETDGTHMGMVFNQILQPLGKYCSMSSQLELKRMSLPRTVHMLGILSH